jgi:hypothetical protein
MARMLHRVVQFRRETAAGTFEKALNDLSSEGYEYVGPIYRSDGEPWALLHKVDPGEWGEAAAKQKAHDASVHEQFSQAKRR